MSKIKALFGEQSIRNLFRNLFRVKCSGWCGKCLYGCVMATGKEKSK